MVLIFAQLSVYASVNDFRRAVADPNENLIYPQQLLVGTDNALLILDTISNSSHVKIYSQDGEFISGIIPAGAGEDAAKFDLGLTLLSGKNIIATGENGNLFLLDSEDGWQIIKSFNSEGKLQYARTIGSPLPESSYGGIAIDGSEIFVEYDDQILTNDISLKNDFVRFIGKHGEAIDNWDVANGRVATLVEGEITIFNESAIPTCATEISEILGDDLSHDVFDISLSEKGFLAITGAFSIDEGEEKAFLVLIDQIGEVRSLIYPDRFISSLDWSKSNEIFALVVEKNNAEIVRFDSSLVELSGCKVPLNEPALMHPGKITVASDGAIWIDDQSDKSNLQDPYFLGDSTVLALKRFMDGQISDVSIDKLDENRFGALYLRENGGIVTLSGIKTDSGGIPISTPAYDVTLNENEITVDAHGDAKYVLLASLLNSQNRLLLEPDEGCIYSGTYDGGMFESERKMIERDKIEEGIPAIFPLDPENAVIQFKSNVENQPMSIYPFSLASASFGDRWKSGDFIDLQVLYSADDGTVILYWFPQGLVRVDADFKTLAWLGLGDDAAYNFIDGFYRDGKNYLLDARYNLVYSFDDSAWEQIGDVTLDEVRQSLEKIRALIGAFYAREKRYPVSLNELVDAGIIDEKSLMELFLPFMGEAPVYYLTQKFDYSLVIWGKDDDNTLLKADSRGIEAL
jgi:hypothetical protein